jgi:hypothetical protein
MTGIEKLISKAGGIRKLATEMDVTPEFIHKAKRQNRLPTARALPLAEKYGIDIAELVDDNTAKAIELDRATR